MTWDRAAASRVLRPGGRLGLSDVIAAGDADPALRAEAEQRTGCAAGAVTAERYRDQLLAAGFTGVSITPTADAAGGLSAAIIQAVRPAAPDGILIRPMRAEDSGQVLAVYQAGLDTGQGSFEVTAPSWETFDAARLALLQALIASSEDAGIWTVQSSVFPENTASLRLHERAGFRAVGVRERVGRHHGRWRDTVLIERRSCVAGVP